MNTHFIRKGERLVPKVQVYIQQIPGMRFRGIPHAHYLVGLEKKRIIVGCVATMKLGRKS